MLSQLSGSLRLCLPDEDGIVKIRLAQRRCKGSKRRCRVFDGKAVCLTDYGNALILAVEVAVDPVDLTVIEDLHAACEISRILPWLAQLVLVQIPGAVPVQAVEHRAHKSMQRCLAGLISAGDDIDPCMQRQFIVGKLTEMFQVQFQYFHIRWFSLCQSLPARSASSPY